MDVSIYDFEDNLHSSQLVEYSKEPIMYDFRKISNQVKKLGRPLTNEEAEKYKVKKWGEFEFEMENKKLERFCSVKLLIISRRKEIKMSKEITNVSIDVLKVHPRNTEFFDDISGKEYEEFKNTIQEEGIISEIIVSPDMTIISGHQRFKAAKELGIKMIPIRIREDLIDEDKKLKVLLASNFQRPKNSEAKQRKVAIEYVKLCGYKNGGDRQAQCQNGTVLSLDEIASQLGTSKRNLQRALSIERNLTESMKQLLDDGVISKTIASDLITSLSEEEQEELISKLDVTKIYTQKQVQKYIDEIRELKSNPPKPSDYDSTKKELQDYKKDYSNLKSQFDEKVSELQDLR